MPLSPGHELLAEKATTVSLLVEALSTRKRFLNHSNGHVIDIPSQPVTDRSSFDRAINLTECVSVVPVRSGRDEL